MKWSTKAFIFNFDCRKIPKLLRFTLKVPAKFQNNVFVRATNNDFDQNTHVDFCNIQVTKKSVGKLGTQSINIFYFILLLNFWSNTVVIYSWVCPHKKLCLYIVFVRTPAWINQTTILGNDLWLNFRLSVMATTCPVSVRSTQQRRCLSRIQL